MRKKTLYSGAGLLAIALGAVVVALLASFVPGLRLDLTENRLYTVADGTRELLRTLEQPVTAEFFYTREIGGTVPQIDNYARRVEELLREYQRLFGGKLALRVVNPEPFSEEEDRASELGLMSLPLLPGGPEIHFGLVLTGASGKPEVIDFFRPDREELLEYDLSQAVWKASRSSAPKIALYAGLDVQGGFDMMSRQPTPPWASVAQLEQLYTVDALAPDFAEVPADARLLLLVHPDGLQEKSLRAIDRFVQGGGNVLLFVDPLAERSTTAMFGGGSSSDLGPLLAAWGIDYDPAQVLVDAQLAVPVASDAYGRPVPHLGIQEFGAGEMPADDVVTRRFERVLAASAGVLKKREQAPVAIEPLLVSSDQAMLVDAAQLAELEEHTALYKDFAPTGERYVVAARLHGRFPTAYPAQGSEATAAVAPADASVIVVADSDILSDRLWVRISDFVGQQVAEPFADNGDLLVNAADSLLGSVQLTGIRARGRYERPFDVVDRLEQRAQLNLQAQLEELQMQLARTEQRLAELESEKAKDAASFELNAEQVAEMERFMDERVRMRKQLRDVQHQLGADIESLGRVVKLLNIVVAPLVLVLALAGALALWRRRALRQRVAG